MTVTGHTAGEPSATGVVVPPTSGRVDATQRIAWIDGLRILGALMIFVYHFSTDYERTFGASPTAASFVNASWPHFNEWAISLFVILAGLSLTLAWRPLADVRGYLRRRAVRLLVPLWIIGVPYIVAGIALGLMTLPDLWKVPVWLSGFGAISPATFLPVSEAWWYVTVAFQCALIAPLVLWLVDRVGLAWSLLGMALTTFLSLWVIGQLPAEWHYLTQGLVLARLIEFGVGVLAAHAIRRETGLATIGSLALGLGLAGLLADRLDAVTSAGALGVWIVVVLAFALTLRSGTGSPRWLVTAGLATYPFYLAHAPIGAYTIRVLASTGTDSPWLLAAAALTLSCTAASVVLVLDRKAAALLTRKTRLPDAA